MKSPIKFVSAAIVAMIAFLGNAQGQDLVYRPKNPAFGGATFNYNWLLASAQTQDLTEDTRPKTTSTSTTNTLQSFTESLNRQLLSQISRQIITNQFGEDSLQPGSYSIGDFQIDVSSTLDGLSIVIQDAGTGDQTEILIPFF